MAYMIIKKKGTRLSAFFSDYIMKLVASLNTFAAVQHTTLTKSCAASFVCVYASEILIAVLLTASAVFAAT